MLNEEDPVHAAIPPGRTAGRTAARTAVTAADLHRPVPRRQGTRGARRGTRPACRAAAGLRRTFSVSWPPCSYPTYPGGEPNSRDTVCLSMYSLMSSSSLRMLVRAPGDVAHANVAQVQRSRRQRGSPRPAWGNGAVCPATPGANAHGVPRTAVTSANGAPSRPAGRVQPCRFDLLPPCTPITARQRTPRSDWASRAARIGPLPGDQERRRTTQQDKPASEPHEDQREQTQRHGRSLCPAATPHLSRQVTAIGPLLAPHRRIAAAHRPGRLQVPRRTPLEVTCPHVGGHPGHLPGGPAHATSCTRRTGPW
jgi:hypothetical protein